MRRGTIVGVVWSSMLGVENPRQFRRDQSASERTEWVAPMELGSLAWPNLQMFGSHGASCRVNRSRPIDEQTFSQSAPSFIFARCFVKLRSL